MPVAERSRLPSRALVRGPRPDQRPFPSHPARVDQAGTDLTDATKANASIQAELLSKASTVLAPMVKEGTLKIVAACFDLATGKVTLV